MSDESQKQSEDKKKRRERFIERLTDTGGFVYYPPGTQPPRQSPEELRRFGEEAAKRKAERLKRSAEERKSDPPEKPEPDHFSVRGGPSQYEPNQFGVSALCVVDVYNDF